MGLIASIALGASACADLFPDALRDATYPSYLFFALNLLQRALCAAAIFARAFADILRRLRFGLAVPL